VPGESSSRRAGWRGAEPRDQVLGCHKLDLRPTEAPRPRCLRSGTAHEAKGDEVPSGTGPRPELDSGDGLDSVF
jgi:hypothetical protein